MTPEPRSAPPIASGQRQITLADLDDNVAGLLWRAAAARGGHIAVRERGRSVSYAALRDRAAAIGQALSRTAVAPGDRIAIFLERGSEAIAAIFGVLATGAVPTVINERLRPRQVEYILEHAEAKQLLTSVSMLERQPRPVSTSVPTVDIERIGAAAAFTPRRRAAGDLAQIIYTSGSTGLPKGVMLTQRGLCAAIGAVVSYLGIDAEDRVAALLSFSSVYGLNQVLCAITVGATLVIETSPLPHQIVSTLHSEGVTVLAAVPPLWLQLLGTPLFTSTPVPTLRQVQNAGGHLPPAVVRRVRAAQPQARLFLQYGSTEAFRSTYLPPEEVDRRPDSIGVAIPGTEMLVLNDDLAPCAVGEVGQLVHRGPTVAVGYWRDDEATRRVFRPYPFDSGTAEQVVFTGDFVRRDEHGFLYFVGRRDRLIKTLGFRVGPDEIADVLFASDEIVDGIVTHEPDSERGDRIVAYVVLAARGSIERLLDYARRELPRHMMPTRIEARDTIPRLASGKYDIASLSSHRDLAAHHHLPVGTPTP
jgi:amino acid adenylation domain-containing protein